MSNLNVQSSNQEAVSRQEVVPRDEYPRPRLVRRDWMCLNGAWEFAFDDAEVGLHDGWSNGRSLPERITVPFAYQTESSGINDKAIHEVVWYARSFEVPRQWRVSTAQESAAPQEGAEPCDVLLHFGAVDYRTTVWINGQEVGHNRGGHVPFSFDITPYLKEGENRLCVRVEDRQDPHQPRGKQSSSGKAHGIDYFCTTGIWQTVWLEPVAPVRIEDVRVTPLVGQNAQDDTLEVAVFLHAPATGWNVQVEVLDKGQVVAQGEEEAVGASARLLLPLPQAKRWSPQSPHLYELRVRLLEAGRLLDEVASYAGVRSVQVRGGQFLLNGEPLYLKMVLDQGYWPQSHMTAPADEALRADVEMTKAFGFNGARKHQKVEDPRWLYWCDRLGLLVWSEMPNARAWSPEAEEWLLAEWERAVRRDLSHPCVVTWVPVNESMGFPNLRDHHPGQYAFVERIVALTRRLDPDRRPVIDNDGWEHTDVADIIAIHDYTPTAAGLRERYAQTLRGGPLPATVWYQNKPMFLRGSRYRGQPIMLTEVGGFLMEPDLPAEQRDRLYQFYASLQTSEELLRMYRDLMQGLAELRFVCGFCYTQLTDIEQEINGLLNYDRRPKVEPEQIAAIHHALWPTL